MCIILRWPDRQLPRCFVEGFPVIGDVEESHIFRQLPDTQEAPDIREAFFGQPAIDFVNNLKSSPPKVTSPKLAPKVQEELAKGRFFNPMTRAQADILFGRGNWRPMPLFVIEQASKDRLISDAKKGGHNSAVHEVETIFVPSADFIPEVLRNATSALRESSWLRPGGRFSLSQTDSAYHWLPPLFQPVMGTEDLDEAYGRSLRGSMA